MKILVLGGTWFLGRDFIEAIRNDDQYDITLFNRGKTNSDLFPGIKRISGDRNTDDVRQLEDQHWDVVVDFSCYFPPSFKELLEVLQGKVGRYIFISTGSVFNISPDRQTPFTEDDETLSCTAEHAVDTTMAFYGEKKAECERILLNSGLDIIILRPSLVYGPYDPFDRLYYWLYRVKNNYTYLLPDNGQRVISYTYVKDLTRATVNAMLVKKHRQVYDLSTHMRVSLQEILEASRKILKTTDNPTDIQPEWLHKKDIKEWIDLPLWVDGDYFVLDNQRAVEDLSLPQTPMENSLETTIQYYNSIGWPEPKYGLSREKEEALLKIYQE